ncbi:MAG: hypothetical protein O3A46_03265, partial [Candidatus Poribacteria bacterium]|nr:hypothetical protein [Candidatus Poribacteria bacterium]
EKAVSYIRGKIRATAERNGRNSDVAEAMVDKKKVLVRLKGVEGGGIELLSPAQFQSRQEAGDEFEIISHEGELLTLTTDAALDLHFVETRANTLEELLATYSIVEDADGMRVMSAAQIAAAQQSPDAKLTVIESLDGATVTRFQRSLLESLSIAVTSSMIGSLLLSLGMLGIMIEFRTPGFGIPGIIGLACIGLFFGGHMIADVGASWGLIAFLVGLGLLGLELFVIPGFGIAGISGIALMLGGLLFVFGQNAPTFTAAVSSLGLSLGVAVALMVVVAFTLPRTRAWNRLILSNEERAIDGYRSASAELVALLGVNGVALTTLRPAGTAEIDSERVDVVSEGAFIPAQTRVRVVQVEGGRVVVRPVTDEAMTAQEGLTNG